MSERNYYVLCDDNCKFEGMTKEQTLTAITQAVETHQISDVDTGFVTKLKDSNKNRGLEVWAGTQAEYNRLDPKPENCFFLITDDPTEEEIDARLSALETSVQVIGEAITQINQNIAEIWEHIRN